ncbi:MAG: DUF1559 domain-containing protein, partial [Thermoguttaceae bacterium]
GLGVLIALLLPMVSCAREPARQMMCANQLKMFGLALLNYQTKYGQFPPACVFDKTGRPMHSWRVLILPFMEMETLYHRYQFDEPWNSPDNKKLFSKRPRDYACPNDRQPFNTSETPNTSYLAVVGPNTAWNRLSSPAGDAMHMGEKELKASALVVETTDASVPWTEPKDWNIDAPATAKNGGSLMKPCHKHIQENGFFRHDTTDMVHVLMADGSVRRFSAQQLSADRLKRGAAGSVGFNDLSPPIHWPHCFLLFAWMVAVVLLLVQAVRHRKGRKAC